MAAPFQMPTLWLNVEVDAEQLICEVAHSTDLQNQYDAARQRPTRESAHGRERRREQCRVSQKTFRERKKKEQEDFELSVQVLENKVRDLEERKAQLIRSLPLQYVLAAQPDFDGGAPAKLARKYINVFKTGYVPSKRRAGERQERFLRAIADEDINYNGAIGIQCILDNWSRYTSSFSAINIEAFRCDVMKTDDGAIVKGVTRSTLKMNRQSIELFFPNCPDTLKPRLIGQNLIVVATMHWSFDEHDRLVQLTGRGDFTSGLLTILQSPEDVAMVLTRSRIVPAQLPPPSSSPRPGKLNVEYLQT
ncbi:Aste57867_18871 [Aphanomyces stellatus]|uniref:Aste57867_18871 protein n=1 Tax=Aphanomyces stellatus TaxID=120398 RepID=A0A485LBF7_9STRA|nr:hypothetical protein As57867_018807 [Aphanomyces stellatus]VFT95605.1 Aste57867_18871 [Aphanomyces stellatus]